MPLKKVKDTTEQVKKNSEEIGAIKALIDSSRNELEAQKRSFEEQKTFESYKEDFDNLEDRITLALDGQTSKRVIRKNIKTKEKEQKDFLTW